MNPDVLSRIGPMKSRTQSEVGLSFPIQRLNDLSFNLFAEESIHFQLNTENYIDRKNSLYRTYQRTYFENRLFARVQTSFHSTCVLHHS